jgi:hypothetical protein
MNRRISNSLTELGGNVSSSAKLEVDSKQTAESHASHGWVFAG